MPFLLAEILNFQGSTHQIGVGSFSILYIDIYVRYTGMPMQDDHTCYLHMFHVSVNIKQCPKGRGKRRSDESTF